MSIYSVNFTRMGQRYNTLLTPTLRSPETHGDNLGGGTWEPLRRPRV